MSRHKYLYEGRVIYEWDQTAEDVNIYIRPPEGVTASMISCIIKTNSLSVGVKGVPPYLSHDLSSTCVADESMWTLDNGELHIILTKAKPCEVWPSVFVGHATADEQSDDRKRILLERFEKENPGFDFSQAEFNGSVPDPRGFLGGPKF